jgi:U6 snRNA-associated Sm-like protein LSm7
MSERGAFRGRGGGRGGDRGGRGGGRGGAQGGAAAAQTERPKKENILDLSKYMDKQITVKFSGGREGESIGYACGGVVGERLSKN